jgi:hypothetical protein
MKDIVAEIAAAIPAATQGPRPWWERVSDEHVATVKAIHDAWHAGAFGSRKSTAARVIADKLKTLGITIGEQGVLAWLKLPTY